MNYGDSQLEENNYLLPSNFCLLFTPLVNLNKNGGFCYVVLQKII